MKNKQNADGIKKTGQYIIDNADTAIAMVCGFLKINKKTGKEEWTSMGVGKPIHMYGLLEVTKQDIANGVHWKNEK